MSRYDEAFVDRFLAPWNRHDVDGALALMTDDCVWEVTRGLSRTARCLKDRLRSAWRSPAPSKRLRISTTSRSGVFFGEDHVVVELLVTGTLRDGTKTKFHACDILTMRDGLIAAKRSYRKVPEWK